MNPAVSPHPVTHVALWAADRAVGLLSHHDGSASLTTEEGMGVAVTAHIPGPFFEVHGVFFADIGGAWTLPWIEGVEEVVSPFMRKHNWVSITCLEVYAMLSPIIAGDP